MTRYFLSKNDPNVMVRLLDDENVELLLLNRRHVWTEGYNSPNWSKAYKEYYREILEEEMVLLIN